MVTHTNPGRALAAREIVRAIHDPIIVADWPSQTAGDYRQVRHNLSWNFWVLPRPIKPLLNDLNCWSHDYWR